MNDLKVPKRIANVIMNALQGGVVPRTGLGYIAVGRDFEINALLKDLELIEEGAATFRFVTGNYGSGKTFLLQTIKEHALAKGFIVADADLSPERSLIGNIVEKKGLATYRELMNNISCKTAPTGGALEKILDNWLDSIWSTVITEMASGGIDGSLLTQMVSKKITDTINSMHGMVNGFDFAEILKIYWTAKQNNDFDTKNMALKWLRGEYRLKTDAHRELGVSGIITDEDWFNYVKMFSEFVVKMGHKGLIIMIDEMINIYKYSHSTTRQKNYERMLNMYNDSLQGKVHHLGIIFGGTPKSVEDTERGVFSYEALKSRLESGRMNNTLVNYMTPIIRIQPLSKSELVVLIEKLAQIHKDLYGCSYVITEEDYIAFIESVYANPETLYITPRSVIRDFIDVLNILYQNPGAKMQEIIKDYNYSDDVEEEPEEVDE